MRRFQYNLRGLLLVTTLLAVSFSLIRTSRFFADGPNSEQELGCWIVGIHLLLGTVGGAAGFLLSGNTKGATIGVISAALLFWAYLLVFVGPVMRN
jgi:hypothetical protein